MSSEPRRLRLSAAQVALMNELLEGAAPEVALTAAGVADGEPQPDADIDALIQALSVEMLSASGFDGEGLTRHGAEIDDIIGVVQQMSANFYD